MPWGCVPCQPHPTSEPTFQRAGRQGLQPFGCLTIQARGAGQVQQDGLHIPRAKGTKSGRPSKRERSILSRFKALGGSCPLTKTSVREDCHSAARERESCLPSDWAIPTFHILASYGATCQASSSEVKGSPPNSGRGRALRCCILHLTQAAAPPRCCAPGHLQVLHASM